MDELASLRVFLEVARRMSFAGAADHFGISRASVTKHVARLEQSMQARLLNRTTKRMSLTPAGMEVVDSGQGILQSVEDLRSAITSLSKGLSGVIRVGVAPSFGAHRLAPVLASFCDRYPDVQVSLILLTQRKEERFVAEGMDVGIIIGARLKDATHSALPLAPAPQALVASPDYLIRHGPIAHLQDLQSCNCLVNINKSPTSIWKLIGPHGPVSVHVRGSLRADFGEPLRVAAIGGMGVSMHPYYMVGEDLRRGNLEVVLPQYIPEQLHLSAIYSARTRVPQHVRAFLDFLQQWTHAHPQWPEER